MDFLWECRTIVVPILLVMSATIFLFAIGQRTAAEKLGLLGPALIMLGNVLYIVFIHGRSRWPDSRWYERLANLLTFTR